MSTAVTTDRTDPTVHDHDHDQEVTDMFLSDLTDQHTGDVLVGLLDPLSKQCPDDVPCRVQNPDLWFAEDPTTLEHAKTLCGDCPARLACLDGALERREPWGVWGGEIFDHGVVIARKRPRGRPRKDARRIEAA